MIELIDRQALLDDIYRHLPTSEMCGDVISKEDMRLWITCRIENAPTVEPASPWHRVEDGLPKYGQDVLAARLYGADSDGWAYEVIIAHVCEVRGTNYWNATNVTHWMPLPEPPKEDA